MHNILVLCIGNICRSPIAEAMFSSRLLVVAPEVKINSAGIGALVGHSADKIAQEIALQRGLDLSQHRARQLTSELVFNADLILTMDGEQKQHVEMKYAASLGRVHRLGKWGEFDVPDPFRRPKIIFEQALALIEQGVDEWCKTLWV